MSIRAAVPADAGVIYDGELYAIYLLGEHQGRGIGRRFVELVVAWLREQGHESMRVWVLEGNPAQRFYERHGFVATHRTDGRGNEEGAPDILYVWGG